MTPDGDECIFCNMATEAIVVDTRLFKAFLDGFPVNRGHMLIVPRRHVPRFFEMNSEEFAGLEEIIRLVKVHLDLEYKPDGYNIGVNVGEAAGQTVFHMHVHVIPRYNGDVERPRGGIRNFKTPVRKYE